mmetsp:Transcript_24117/g.69317  ORF Transcript_24117/g.69317 Transcript_24117/m.69317 type:complete len:121 (+) Transcript_24117:331-693(+)
MTHNKWCSSRSDKIGSSLMVLLLLLLGFSLCCLGFFPSSLRFNGFLCPGRLWKFVSKRRQGYATTHVRCHYMKLDSCFWAASAAPFASDNVSSIIVGSWNFFILLKLHLIFALTEFYLSC